MASDAFENSGKYPSGHPVQVLNKIFVCLPLGTYSCLKCHSIVLVWRPLFSLQVLMNVRLQT